jgi:adenylate kinase
VIHLVVDDATIVARLSGRRQCPVCGTLYSNQTHPPKRPGICDNDGTPLVKREDDRESVIRERLEQYELQTRPLLQYFREAGLPVIETEAAKRSPQQVLQEICAELLAANIVSPEAVPHANVVK